MNIAFFGSSLVSAYWNGAATYYRGILRALHERGHAITFYEPDAYHRQQHRDIDDPPYAKVVVYSGTDVDEVFRQLEAARSADLIVKASGVGVWDELLEREVLRLRRPDNLVAFWDVDAPATLDRTNQNASDPFRSCVPRYDLVLTYGGGARVQEAYKALGAQKCEPVYNALDPQTHFPVAREDFFAGDVGFLGNRLPDREIRVDEFFFRAATLAPERTFLLGGAGWDDKERPSNVKYLGHVYTRDHNAFHRSPTMALNISRDSMARYGYSPATRVFEAAGASACLVTDDWEGVEAFFAPGEEILVARDGEEVAHLLNTSPQRARAIGDAALRRALNEHTYAHRAKRFEEILSGAV